MASLRKECDRGRTGWRLQIRINGKRRSLWLSDPSKRRAETVKRHVEELVRSKSAGGHPDPATDRWVATLDGKLFDALLRIELVDPKREQTSGDEGRFLGAFLDAYIQGRTDVGDGTTTNYKQARRLLVGYFKPDKLLRSITSADADRWRRWLLARPVKWDEAGKVIKTMASATVSKHVKRAKTMFAEAVRDRLLAESPFADQKGTSEANRDRHHFVDGDVTAAVLDACPDHDWKLVFGLARFGGLRCPSEVTRLKWSDVQWDANRLRIDSTKTGLRFCPIFPELRPILEAAAAERENDLVMNRRLIIGYAIDANLATQLQRIVERAGETPWPKTFINLRSTRRTELQERFPSHVVDAWLGHSTKTAEIHYLQVTADHWRAGASLTTNKRSANSVSMANQSGGVASGVISADQSQSGDTAKDTAMPENHKKSPARLNLTELSVTPTGLEPVSPP